MLYGAGGGGGGVAGVGTTCLEPDEEGAVVADDGRALAIAGDVGNAAGLWISNFLYIIGAIICDIKITRSVKCDGVWLKPRINGSDIARRGDFSDSIGITM